MKNALLSGVLVAVLVVLGVVLFKSGGDTWIEGRKGYAHALRDRGLHKQAVQEYRSLINSGVLSNDERAKLAYIIGDIQMSDIKDYEEALAAFTMVKALSPKSKLIGQVEVKSVECLERLGRPFEAGKEMKRLTSLKPEKHVPGEAVVAVVGDRKITMKELEKQIASLPPGLQKIYREKGRQLEFLKQYIATELLYDSARRRNFDKDPEIVEQALQARKQLMVRKLMEQETREKVKVTSKEIELYYKAHEDEFSEGEGKEKRIKPLGEVGREIAARLEMEKKEEAYQELIERLVRAERVMVYEELFVPQRRSKTP